MKPILLATDYSPASRNAGDFAAELARTFDCELIVLHAWTPPVTSAESVSILPFNEIAQVQKEAVDAEASRLANAYGVRARGLERSGFAGEEIGECVREENIGLVVLGMSHHNAAGRMLGSVATVSLHKAVFPSLIIPESVSFRKPSKILLATDLHASDDWHELNTLNAMAEISKAEIHILNVVAEEKLATVEESSAGIRLEHKLSALNHTWHFPVNDDIPRAIEETATSIGADWIAVVPHHLPWYKDLFHKSVTKQLAFIADRPLLTLPGE
jgi:nucleotide-binding universal stress UspA family protein